MLPIDSEVVEYQILVNAAAAIEQLRVATKSAQSFNQEVTLAGQAAQRFAMQNNVSLKQSISVLRNMDAAIANVREDMGVFADQGARGWSTLGAAAESGSRRAVRSIDAMRIALGVLVSMLIFQVIQAFSNTFRAAIENLRETELAVYNLINAERRLSEQGIDVTPKGLQETIDGIRELIPILSQVQVEELVSRIATNVAPALKFTDEQIRQLSESVSLLYIRNKALGYSFDEIEKAITDAFLTGKVSQGINKFGVKLSDQIVRDEALRLGLVKTADEFDNLTGEMEAQVKAAAMLSVVYQNATQDLDSLDEYMRTFDAQSSRASAAWDNLLTTLSVTLGPVLTDSLSIIAKRLEDINEWLIKNEDSARNFASMIAGVVNGLGYLANTNFGQRLLSPFETIKGFFDAVLEGQSKAIRGFQDLANAADTPTAAIEDLGDAIDDIDFSEFEQKIEDILQDADEKLEDLNTKRARKLEDIDEEYIRKAEDAYRDYQRRVEDINADAEQKREDAIRKAREDDLKAERDYQNKLWELRMRYLMDLEDALHARDARQIIRLQKQYAIDKEALLRKKRLDDQTREEDLAAELAQIEMQRQRRLEDAKRDYEQKLSDQRKAKQRELDDLALWYDREDADRKLHIQRKLQDLINAWIQEGKITQAGAQNVYDILRTYFGPGGLTDQLYQYMQSQLGAMSIAPTLSTPVIAPTTEWSGTSPGGGLAGGSSGSTGGSTGGRDAPRAFAEGGTLIATRPMTATFGEVPEAVTFTPLDNPGNNVGRMFGDTSALGGGVLELLLTLSPDLESRIVRKSMDGVADVVVRVNRSR